MSAARGERPAEQGKRKVRIEIVFGADFADLFEVRGTVRAKKGRSLPAVIDTDSILLSYFGLDERKRSTRLSFDPAPNRLASDLAVYDLQLAPHETRSLFIEIGCDQAEARAPNHLYLWFSRVGPDDDAAFIV